MSRRTSLDTTDFDASNGEMRLLQFSQDEEEEEGEEDSSSRRSRQQDILTGRTYLSSSLQYFTVFVRMQCSGGNWRKNMVHRQYPLCALTERH